ncbi:glycosyltransferase [Boudabousia marimammalium]|uniref:Glycosyltransferase 2-like domain-containing protein n=1 Tax=Boudabousia marimammalium TaxID=156892 RepID=A0A1Q5PRR5_9ACTO|nr:glycosyltransferase [Boudabousia marimammalium]OKL50223.1 hypothetical protein BM477_02180 [Boudabousia marimammalium]
MNKRHLRVVVALVAYNRAALLTECLDALASQSRPVDGVVVVDNASTDETPQVIAQHTAVTFTRRLPRNTGGAGGFAAAIALAVTEEQADLVWIMDDDTIPTRTALEELLKAHSEYPGTPAVLASRAIWIDGATHPMNTHRRRPLLEAPQIMHAEALGAIPVRAASFVSILVDARAIIADGLPEADYFIWNDDLEYTARILRNRVGLYVPASVVEHRTKALASATDDPGDRFYYESRNKMWFLRAKHLRLRDRVLWGGSMVLRWAKMLSHSTQRRKMLRLGYQGIREGLSTKPIPSAQILTNTPAESAVRLIDEGKGQRGPLRILFAGSSGGHLTQLRNLQAWYRQHRSLWLTFDTPDALDALRQENVVWAHHSPQRSWRDLVSSFSIAWNTVTESRPDLVVSAGASLGALTVLVARLKGIPTVYIEVFDRIDLPSLSGRICYHFADEFCVQWEEQTRIYPNATVIGPLL